MRSPIIYDIRRSLLRPATLILALVLALAGAGLAYLVLGSFTIAQSQSQYYLVFTGRAISGGISEPEYIGLVITAQGQPVGGARVLIDGHWYTTNSSGYVLFNLSTGMYSYLTVNVGGVNYTASLVNAIIVDVDLASRSGELFAAAPPLPLMVNRSVVYNVYYYQGQLFAVGRASYTSLTYLGHLEPGSIGHWRIRLVLNKPVVYIYMNLTNASSGDPGPGVTVVTSTAATGTSVTALPPVTLEVIVPQLEVSEAKAIAEAMAFELLAEFLPLAALLVVNDLFAKPRASGALDYVLSRPITKGQLYTSRLLSGLAAMIIGVIIGALLTSLVVAVVLRVGIDVTALAYASLALVVDILSFYSLLYMISVLTPRHYMAVSAALYVVLYLVNIFGILALMGYPWMVYLSPRSLFQSLLSLGGLSPSVGIISALPASQSLSGTVIASATWIIAPALLGFIIYRRQDAP